MKVSQIFNSSFFSVLPKQVSANSEAEVALVIRQIYGIKFFYHLLLRLVLALFSTFLILIYLSSYLNQETAMGPFRSSSQAVNCYYQSNHSKVEAISLSCELAVLSSHYPFNAESQQRSCEYQLLKSFSLT